MTICFPLRRFNESTKSFEDFHDEFAVRIDVPPIHSRSVEGQSNVALAINCDQSASATEFGHLVENRLGGFFQRHSSIFHQGRHIVSNRRSNKVLAIPGRGDGACRIVGVSARANYRSVTDAAGPFICRAAC